MKRESETRTITIIPAPPGWAVCVPVHGPREVVGVDLEPVIAWAIDTGWRARPGDASTIATPILALYGAGADPVLRRPDGTFGNLEGDYADEEQVIAHFRETDARRTARRKHQTTRGGEPRPPGDIA